MEYTIAGTLYRTREGAVAALASLILPDPEVMGDAPFERRAGGVRGRAAELVAEWERGGAVHADLRAMLLDTLTRRIMDAALRWRAYDVVTEWSGPPPCRPSRKPSRTPPIPTGVPRRADTGLPRSPNEATGSDSGKRQRR